MPGCCHKWRNQCGNLSPRMWATQRRGESLLSRRRPARTDPLLGAKGSKSSAATQMSPTPGPNRGQKTSEGSDVSGRSSAVLVSPAVTLTCSVCEVGRVVDGWVQLEGGYTIQHAWLSGGRLLWCIN